MRTSELWRNWRAKLSNQETKFAKGVETKYHMVIEDNEMFATQTVIKPHNELWVYMFKRGWRTSNSGNPFIMFASENYLHPRF